MSKFGLVGNNISRSLSKQIHEIFLGSKYDLISCENKKDFLTFLNSEFDYINITKPYKQIAYNNCDELSTEAKDTGVVNLIIKKDNKKHGYNTDVFGFEKLLEKHCIDLDGKDILILGTGATSKTICYVAKKHNAKSIIFVSRNPNSESTISYNDISKANDAQIVINTTPIGAFDDSEKVLIEDVSIFKNVEVYIDVNYLPFHNKQSRLFKEIRTRVVSGYSMLFYQALKSYETYTTTTLHKHDVDDYYKDVFLNTYNIVLIGHPFAGKTTVGNELAKHIDTIFVDTDEMIELFEGMSISEIFSSKGEEEFRKIEKSLMAKAGELRGQVIALGGGSVLNKEEMDELFKNSLVINLYRDLSKINEDDIKNRPLSRNIDEIKILIEKRSDLYHKYSDYSIDNSSIEETVHKIGGLL